jgi:hypothetical protein
MPDFTFTSPEGKKYTVTGPEGSTSQEAFGILQKQLATPSNETVESQKEEGPKYGAGESALEGTLSGVSANWRDEIYGASKASGLPEWMGGFRAPIGAGRLAYEKFTGEPGTATSTYDQAVQEMRSRHAGMQEQHPYAYGGGEFAGAIGGMAFAPGSRLPAGAGLLARLGQGAKVGAGYGAVAGAGASEGGPMETALGAGIGAATGAAGGAGGAALGEAGATVARPIMEKFRGWQDPSGKAAQRALEGIQSGQQALAAGKERNILPFNKLGTTPDAMLADVGGARTKEQIRNAGNVSPEAWGTLEKAFGERGEQTKARLGDSIRDLIPGKADTFAARQKLKADYDSQRTGLYEKAYAAGDRLIDSPLLQRFGAMPMVQKAIKEAITTGKDRAVIEGHGTFNAPYVITPTGNLVVNRKANGVLEYPNLQFWDYVKKGLDNQSSMAFEAGDKDTGSMAAEAAKRIRNELDKIVPEYQKARGVAANYYGTDGAAEAGMEAVNTKDDPRVIQALVKKMTPAEKELYQEGHASALAQKAEQGGARVIANLFSNPTQVKVLNAIHGPQGTAGLHAALLRENIFKAAAGSLGGSTTARQLMQGAILSHLGAGGIGSGIGGVAEELRGGDFHMGAVGGAVAGVVGKKLTAGISQDVAREFAELITSNDPTKLQAGIAMAAKDKRFLSSLQWVADKLARGGAAIGGTIGGSVAPKKDIGSKLYEE